MTTKPVVYMDSCCFIDLAKSALSIPVDKKREPHVFYCRKFLDAARAGHITVHASTLAVVECVVLTDSSKPGSGPIEDEAARILFRGMLLSGKSGVIPVVPTPRMTEAARDLRWVHDITCKPMDATHIATALAMKCTHFLTTDTRIGVDNTKKIAALGLAVCTADHAVELLPDEYKQFTLQPAPKKA